MKDQLLRSLRYDRWAGRTEAELDGLRSYPTTRQVPYATYVRDVSAEAAGAG